MLGLVALTASCGSDAEHDGGGAGTSSVAGASLGGGGSAAAPGAGGAAYPWGSVGSAGTATPGGGGTPGGAAGGARGGAPGAAGNSGPGVAGNGAQVSDCVPNGRARNPLVSQIFTADPNAIEYDGRLYVYVSHDEDGMTAYDMVDHHVFSSDDLVNWQDHGVVIRADDLTWGSLLYAPTACERDGTYYMFLTNGGSQIGVAVADNPGGPFTDPLRRGLLTPSFPNADVPWLFDPACFIDDDGQAYLYFGGGPDGGQNARVVRLNEDMVSLMDASATTIPTTEFFEASFMHKHEGTYYFSYSASFNDGHNADLEYYMADNPMMEGGRYMGALLRNDGGVNGDNNHGSIVEFQGKHYIFYHNRKLTRDLGRNNSFERSIAVQELTYAAIRIA